MARLGINEAITVLLLLSVLYQSANLFSYKPRHQVGRAEAQQWQAKYVSGGVSPREAEEQPLPPSSAVVSGSMGRGHKNLQQGSKARIKGVSRGVGASVRGGNEYVSEEVGQRHKKQQQQQQQQQQDQAREGAEGSESAKKGVSIEAISEEEARKFAVADGGDVVVGGEETGEGEDGEDMDQGSELSSNHPPERPITLGGEPKWQHEQSGTFGGIGPPKDGSDEQLYLLNQTHFLLHQHQFEVDGQRGGWISDNGRPRSAILRYPTILPSGAEAVEQVGFLAEDLDLMPYNDTRWRFATCAIISNSGSLLHSHFGNEIDAHDMVMRINHAPVVGFRRFVGVRTTFDICNRPHAKRLTKVSVLRKGQRSSLVLFETLNWNVYYRLYRQLYKLYPFPGTAVLSPDLLIATMALWRKLALKFPKDAYSCSAIKRAAAQGSDNKRCQYMKHDCDSQICKPSSGFFALVFAAQMCNQIDMYGFEAYRFNSQMAKITKYHYFDDETGMTNVHSFVLLMKVFEYLSQRYPIRIRTSEEGSVDLEADEIKRLRLRF